MDLHWSPSDLAFRSEVRAFLEAELSAEMRRASAKMTSVYAPPEISREWQQRLHKRGWVAPSWPAQFGGCDWSQVQRNIIYKSFGRQ